jgi:hypothetical protein
VPSGGNEISFFLEPGFGERGERWLVVRLSVGQDMVWDMLPNPVQPRSTISPQSLADLIAREGTPDRTDAGDVILRDMQIARQPLPDLAVRISTTPDRLRVNGILGLDFFQQFHVVHWRPRTHLVVLVGE